MGSIDVGIRIQSLFTPTIQDLREMMKEPEDDVVHTEVKSSPPPDLLIFERVTIRGISFGRVKGQPVSGTFQRTLSFPASRGLMRCDSTAPPFDLWAPIDDLFEGHLNLHLGKKIGEGASASVYSATLVSPTDLNIPKRLCIKVAKSKHARNIAREAWFYDQIHKAGNLAGVATPRCFGLFSAFRDEINEEAGCRTRFKPWAELEEQKHPNPLPDDYGEQKGFKPEFRDDYKLKKGSLWNDWEQFKKDPIFVILVLEELGAPYPAPSVVQEDIADIKDIVADLAHAGIEQCDMRFCNVLRSVSNDSSSFCPRHQKTHAYRVIDFELSKKYALTDGDPTQLQSVLTAVDLVGESYFMGYALD